MRDGEKDEPSLSSRLVLCDWCLALGHRSVMEPIGVAATGWGRGLTPVYLCSRPECGHEREEGYGIGPMQPIPWEEIFGKALSRRSKLG